MFYINDWDLSLSFCIYTLKNLWSFLISKIAKFIVDVKTIKNLLIKVMCRIKWFMVIENWKSYALEILFSHDMSRVSVKTHAAVHKTFSCCFSFLLTRKFDSLIEYTLNLFLAKKLPKNVNLKGVFAANELDLEEVNVYGFDYDYTYGLFFY